MPTLRLSARQHTLLALFATLFLACLPGSLSAQTTGKDNWFPVDPADKPAPALPPAPAPAATNPPAQQPSQPPPAPAAKAPRAAKTPVEKPAPVIWTQNTAPRNDYSKDPAKTLILNLDLPWSYWNSANQAVECSRRDGFTRFVINEPGGRDIWYRPITTAPLWERYPILVMRYRTTGLARKNAGHGLAFSDGTDQHATSIIPLMFEHFIADGEIHEVRADLRLCPKRKNTTPGTLMGNLTFALKAEPEQTLIFDLYDIRFEADPDKPNPPIKLDLQGTVAVTDPTGQPVVGALVRPAGEWANLAPEVRTDSKGQAQLRWGTGESFGLYTYEGYKPRLTVVATKPGYYTGVASHSLPLEFGSPVAMTTAQRISGILTDTDGSPIAGAGVYVGVSEKRPESRRGIYASQHMVTNAQGKWETDPFPALRENIAISTIKLADRRYISQSYYLGSDSGRPVAAEIQLAGQTGNKFILQKGVTISGRTLDKSNNPIPGVRISIERPPYEAGTGMLTNQEVRSDKMGLYTLGPLPPATYNLSVIAPRSAPAWPSVKVANTKDPVTLDINLDPAKPIKARLVDEAGKPLPLTNIGCYRWNNHNLDFSVRTNPDGKFTWFAPPQDFVDFQINPGNNNEPSHEVTLYPSDQEYTIKLLSDGKFALTPEAVGPPPTPIPAPEKLSQPTPGQSLTIGFKSSNSIMQWTSDEPGTGGLFPSPNSLTLLWQNGNFARQGAYIQPNQDFNGPYRIPFKKVVIQYRATTEPAWQPDIPLTPNRDRIGFSFQASYSRSQYDCSATDFVPDGKLREITIDLPQRLEGPSGQQYIHAFYLRMAPQAYAQKTYSGKIQSIKMDLTRVWIETGDLGSSKAKPYQQIVHVLDANEKPIQGCNVRLQQENSSLSPQTTDASGTAFFTGFTASTEPKHAIITTSSKQTHTVALQPGITTFTLPKREDFENEAPKAPLSKTLNITGIVTTPAGPASSAIVWISRQARGWDPAFYTLTNEKGEFSIPSQNLSNQSFPQDDPDLKQPPLKIYARLHDMAIAQPLSANSGPISLNLLPIVRPEIIVKDFKIGPTPPRYSGVEIIGYASVRMENHRTLKFTRPSLIAGDTIQIRGNLEGFQALSMSDIKVTPDMGPITLAFQPGYKALVTFVDDLGAPLPNFNVYAGPYASGTPTDAKGQIQFSDLVPNENTGTIGRRGDRFAAHLGDGQFKLNIQPGDPSIVQNIKVPLLWTCNLKVIDQATGTPIPLAYVALDAYADSPFPARQEFTQTLIDNSKYRWFQISAKDAAPLRVLPDKAALIIWAPGYKTARLNISKADAAPRNHEIKLEKAPSDPLPQPTAANP